MVARKIRKDSTVKSAEKRLGLKDGIKNPDGSNARGDKLIGTLRKEYGKKGKK
jgi:deferrochelatase/peroxidase EfeB